MNKDMNKENRKDTRSYAYYSRLLKEPFDSIEELKEAEEAYYAKQKAKLDKVATKKADAKKVEEAFKALNLARKTYKEALTTLTQTYSEDLAQLKKEFEAARDTVKATLASAEDAYSVALKEFTNKYPEGYHLTLKDGDFETTISSESTSSSKATAEIYSDLFKWVFGI